MSLFELMYANPLWTTLWLCIGVIAMPSVRVTKEKGK